MCKLIRTIIITEHHSPHSCSCISWGARKVQCMCSGKLRKYSAYATITHDTCITKCVYNSDIYIACRILKARRRIADDKTFYMHVVPRVLRTSDRDCLLAFAGRSLLHDAYTRVVPVGSYTVYLTYSLLYVAFCRAASPNTSTRVAVQRCSSQRLRTRHGSDRDTCLPVVLWRCLRVCN